MSANLFTKASYALGISLWVLVSFFVGEMLAGVVASYAIAFSGVVLNPALQSTILAALGYTFGLAMTIGLPWLATRMRPSRATLGVTRLLSWSDIGLSVLSVLPYYLLSAGILWIAMHLTTAIDPTAKQQIGFNNLSMGIEYFVAFITLVLMAPFAEELLFRGYFLGRLKERTGKWVAVLLSAAVFGLLHLFALNSGGHIVIQWATAADTFALGIVAGSLRLVSGSIWAGMLLHGLKNAIAYYFLFISPLPPGGS
jgi:membrane protease YdiL (CAAX protease family)